MAVSNAPLQLDAKRWLEVLSRYKIDGKPVFDLSQQQHRRRLQEVMAMVTTMDRDIRPGSSPWNLPATSALVERARA
jgi:hypothetical protein